MTDKTRTISQGKQFYVRFGPKPAGGWETIAASGLALGDTLTVTAVGETEPPPDPPPTDPPPTTGKRGFGKNTTGSGDPVTSVTALAALRTVLAGGKNVKVDVPAGTVWSLGGSDLVIKSNTTCDFGNLTLMGASVRISGPASNIMLTNLRSHCGDQFGNATDLDALTINGNNGSVRNVYIRNSQMLWGPDTDTAILGDIADVTFERCVFAEGLYNSNHAESPHSLGPNVASEDPSTPAQRISFIECLVSTNQSRNFRLIGVGQAELIGCTIYNHNEGPQGSPTSANLLGCTWKKGPNPLANTFLFRAQDGGHGAFTAKANTVYEHGGQVMGYVSSGVDPKVKATAPLFASTEAEPGAVAAHATTLANAGAVPADKQLQRVRQNVSFGSGDYVNGIGKPGSYTSLL